jgi:hypothetical protein
MRIPRKFLLPSAVFLALAAGANAQSFAGMTCTATAPTPLDMRGEGVTEQAGDLVVLCTGGTPTPSGSPVPQVNFTISVNAFLTSRLLNTSSVASEALLLLGDPSAQAYCPYQNTGCILLGTGAGGGGVASSSTSPYNPAALPLPTGTARYNAYGGVIASQLTT